MVVPHSIVYVVALPLAFTVAVVVAASGVISRECWLAIAGGCGLAVVVNVWSLPGGSPPATSR